MSATIAVKNDKDGIKHEPNDEASPSITDAKPIQTAEDAYFNTFKLILFLLNALIAICLVIPLVVLIWMQA